MVESIGTVTMSFLLLLTIFGLVNTADVEKQSGVGFPGWTTKKPDCEVLAKEASLLGDIVSMNFFFVKSSDETALKEFLGNKTEELKSAVNSALHLFKLFPSGMGQAIFGGIPGLLDPKFLKDFAKLDQVKSGEILGAAHRGIQSFLMRVNNVPSHLVKSFVLNILQDAMTICSNIVNGCTKTTQAPWKTTQDSWKTTRDSWQTTRGPWRTTQAPWKTTRDSWRTTRDSWQTTRGPWRTTQGPWTTTQDSWRTTRESWQTTRDPWRTTQAPWKTTQDSWRTTRDSWQTTAEPWQSTMDSWRTTQEPRKTTEDFWGTTRDPCSTGSLLCNGCDFDVKSDYCGYRITLNGNIGTSFDWEQHFGKSPQYAQGTGPQNDHTTQGGGYMLFPSYKCSYKGQNAIFFSDIQQPAKNGACLVFYYHMRGYSIGFLRVFTSSKDGRFSSSLFSKGGLTGSQYHNWFRAEVNIPAKNERWQIAFQGECGYGKYSDFAIDDIRVENRAC